jgi:hypothetical protein
MPDCGASKSFGTVAAERQNEMSGLEFVQGLFSQAGDQAGHQAQAPDQARDTPPPNGLSLPTPAVSV